LRALLPWYAFVQSLNDAISREKLCRTTSSSIAAVHITNGSTETNYFLSRQFYKLRAMHCSVELEQRVALVERKPFDVRTVNRLNMAGAPREVELKCGILTCSRVIVMVGRTDNRPYLCEITSPLRAYRCKFKQDSDYERFIDKLHCSILSDAHKLLAKEPAISGLDFYCSPCNAMYCEDHFRTEPEWKNGEYAQTVGVCAGRHRRVIMTNKFFKHPAPLFT
jgi:hypothetical protein